MRYSIPALLMISALASTATAQCSSWNNVQGIAGVVGDDAWIIARPLSNNAVFLFSASIADEDSVFLVDDEGLKSFRGDWIENNEGTAVLTDDFGHICTITCDGNGGIVVLIEEVDQSTFTPAAFAVTAEGGVTEVNPPVDCQCIGSGTRNNVICTPGACTNEVGCKFTGTFPGVITGRCQYTTGGDV